jgi:hypothetical protein
VQPVTKLAQSRQKRCHFACRKIKLLIQAIEYKEKFNQTFIHPGRLGSGSEWNTLSGRPGQALSDRP